MPAASLPDSPLGDTETDRLLRLLGELPDRDRALVPDELQGLCAALAMGPDAEPSAGWIEAALGPDNAKSAPPELSQLLERLRVQTAAAIETRTLDIRARATRTGRIDYTGWCSGFLDGVEISQTAWFEIADPDELADLMFPIDVLGGALSERERAAYTAAEWRKLVRDSEGALAETVARLADYWSILRAPPVTVRRDAPKVGRNDPCPCGSGRKFKQCHGSA